MDEVGVDAVLLVDDNLIFLRSFARAWVGYSHAVRTASSSASAIALLQQAPADVVVIDLFIGAESGLELAAEIRHRYPLSSVVVMSGSLETDHAMDAIRVGAMDAVKKGLLPSQILQRLRRTDAPATRLNRSVELPTTLHERERHHINDALARAGGNVTAAAQALGVHPTTIRRKRDKDGRVR